MNRTLRFVMGLSIMFILAPAMGLVIGEGDVEPAAALGMTPIMASMERDPTLSHAERATTVTSSETPSTLPAAPDETSPPDSSDTSHEDTPNDLGHEDHASGDTGGSSDRSPQSGNNKPVKSPSTTTSNTQTSSTIAGEACPCTVTGTAELKGEVSLEGDLIVDGGILIARPGVSLDGNGFQIMFMNDGKADFQGSKVFTWSDRGKKQNLQRDIEFRNLRRIMWMNGGGPSILRYFTVMDSGGSALGDYPLHWHLNGNSTRGTIVEGVVVINGKNHAYVPHGSHGITFKNTIAKNTRGDAYWWDPTFASCDSQWTSDCTLNNSNDIVYDRALADGVTNGPGDQRGFHLTGFRLGAGSGNSVLNSAAINVHPSHRESCSGFHWPEDANQNAGGQRLAVC